MEQLSGLKKPPFDEQLSESFSDNETEKLSVPEGDIKNHLIEEKKIFFIFNF